MKHGHHSPAVRFLGKVTWFVTALVSIFVGLVPLGFNILEMPVIKSNLAPYITPILYVIGALGLVSLIMLFMCWSDETEHKSR